MEPVNGATLYEQLDAAWEAHDQTRADLIYARTMLVAAARALELDDYPEVRRDVARAITDHLERSQSREKFAHVAHAGAAIVDRLIQRRREFEAAGLVPHIEDEDARDEAISMIDEEGGRA